MQMTTERLPRPRSGTMVVAVAVALGFLSLFIAGLHPLITAPASPQEERTQRTSPSVDRPAVPASLAAPESAPPAGEKAIPVQAVEGASQDGAEAVALVNGQAIQAEDLRLTSRVDQAMAALLGTTAATDPQAHLEQAINQALVLQAADQAGFTVAPESIQATLADFLASSGVTPQALTAALEAEGISEAQFQAYFQRLVRVEGFLLAESQAQGLSREAILAALQAQARVSFNAGLEWREDEPSSPQGAVEKVEAAPLTESQEVEPVQAEASSAQTSEATESSQAEQSTEARGTGVGDLAPAFTLPTVNTEEGVLALDDLRGQPVLLSFWTTWCPFCRRQAPVLVEAHARYAERGVQFVGINVKEEQAPVENYLEQEGMTYSVVLDQSGATAQAYQVRGFPTTYFLDAEGRVVARHVGQLSPEQVTDYLDRLLEAPAP